MNKQWKIVIDEADKLLKTRNEPELVLAAGRLRAAALASDEPEEAELPAVRPIERKKPKRKQRTPNQMVQHMEKVWAMTCPSCGAGPNTRCVSMVNTSTRRRGEAVKYVHADRAGHGGIENVLGKVRAAQAVVHVVPEVHPKQEA